MSRYRHACRSAVHLRHRRVRSDARSTALFRRVLIKHKRLGRCRSGQLGSQVSWRARRLAKKLLICPSRRPLHWATGPTGQARKHDHGVQGLCGPASSDHRAWVFHRLLIRSSFQCEPHRATVPAPLLTCNRAQPMASIALIGISAATPYFSSFSVSWTLSFLFLLLLLMNDTALQLPPPPPPGHPRNTFSPAG